MTVADKTQDNLNMSAVFNMMRQTKARKSKSVCRVQSDVADKKSKIDSLSVRFSQARQTEIGKQSVHLPGLSICREQLTAADKRQEILKLSAGFSLMRQTEIAKQAVRLPGTAYCCRQKARNSKSVCRIQPDAADRNSKQAVCLLGTAKPGRQK